MKKALILGLLFVWGMVLYLGYTTFVKKSFNNIPMGGSSETQQKLREQSERNRQTLNAQRKLIDDRNRILDANKSSYNDPARAKRLREEQSQKARETLEKQRRLMDERQRKM